MTIATKTEIFIDIETTDTAHTAGIWEIGTVLVQHHGDGIDYFTREEEYNRLLSPEGSVSNDTLEWIKQKPHVFRRYKKALELNNNPTSALSDYHDFLLYDVEGDTLERDNTTVYTWGNFDIPILVNAFKKRSIKIPWHYGSVVDFRSVMKCHNCGIRPNTGAHSALLDARALRDAVERFRNEYKLVQK